MRIQSSVRCAIRALGPFDSLPFLNLLLALRHELVHVGIHAFRPDVLPHDRQGCLDVPVEALNRAAEFHQVLHPLSMSDLHP